MLSLFLVQTWYFYHKKVVTWELQHFCHKEVIMLSSLHRWDFCWKCEFFTDAKIENYNHHDGERLLFYRKVHIKTQSKKKDVLVIFIYCFNYCKKRGTPVYLITTALKKNLTRTLNAIIQHMKNIDLDEL